MIQRVCKQSSKLFHNLKSHNLFLFCCGLNNQVFVYKIVNSCFLRIMSTKTNFYIQITFASYNTQKKVMLLKVYYVTKKFQNLKNSCCVNFVEMQCALNPSIHIDRIRAVQGTVVKTTINHTDHQYVLRNAVNEFLRNN